MENLSQTKKDDTMIFMKSEALTLYIFAYLQKKALFLTHNPIAYLFPFIFTRFHEVKPIALGCC